jgi:hypothetical protein
MAGAGKKWLIGCGAGCGGIILLAIVLSVVGSMWMMRPMNEAVDAQKALNEAFGARDAFVPPAGGITPERMESFLAVRDSLMWQCDRFREIGEKFDRMEAIDNDEDVSTGEALKAVGGLMGSITGMVADMGRFTADRNRILLEKRMSLGEYAWIYVLAYHSWLGHQPGTSFETDPEAEAELSRMERKVIRRLMLNHVEALKEADLTIQAATWEDEILRLERSEGGVPFEGAELPAGLRNSLAPYRERLEALYCPETAGFELNTIKKKGLSIQAN